MEREAMKDATLRLIASSGNTTNVDTSILKNIDKGTKNLQMMKGWIETVGKTNRRKLADMERSATIRANVS